MVELYLRAGFASRIASFRWCSHLRGKMSPLLHVFIVLYYGYAPSQSWLVIVSNMRIDKEVMFMTPCRSKRRFCFIRMKSTRIYSSHGQRGIRNSSLRRRANMAPISHPCASSQCLRSANKNKTLTIETTWIDFITYLDALLLKIIGST